MTPEKQVYVYSILSFVGIIGIWLILFLIRLLGFLVFCYKYRNHPLMDKEYEFNNNNEFQNVISWISLFVGFLSIIASIVFYSLAMTKIRKIKKNEYYKRSVWFLGFSSLIYFLWFIGICFAIGLNFIK